MKSKQLVLVKCPTLHPVAIILIAVTLMFIFQAASESKNAAKSDVDSEAHKAIVDSDQRPAAQSFDIVDENTQPQNLLKRPPTSYGTGDFLKILKNSFEPKKDSASTKPEDIKTFPDQKYQNTNLKKARYRGDFGTDPKLKRIFDRNIEGSQDAPKAPRVIHF